MVQAGDQVCWEGPVVLKGKLHVRWQVAGNDYPPLVSTRYTISKILHPILDPPIKKKKNKQRKHTPPPPPPKKNQPTKIKLESNTVKRKIPIPFIGHWRRSHNNASLLLICITSIPESWILKSCNWQFSLQLPVTQVESLLFLQFLFSAPFFPPRVGQWLYYTYFSIGFSSPLTLTSHTYFFPQHQNLSKTNKFKPSNSTELMP